MSVATVGRKVVKFKNNLHEEFNKTLNQRVNQYFKNTKYGRYANAEMVTKTIFMFCLYLIPYFMFLFGVVENIWVFYLMAFLMGLGIN